MVAAVAWALLVPVGPSMAWAVPGPVPVSDVWPVDGSGGGPGPPAVVRDWAPPSSPYGPGHRGVDLAAPIGAAVRTVAAGRVTFAGRVAGRGVITVELTDSGAPPLRTSYEPVSATVRKGAEVTAGAPLGTLELPTGHCPPVSPSCLHWGLRRGTTYLNPLTLLSPAARTHGPPRLLPLWLGPPPLPLSLAPGDGDGDRDDRIARQGLLSRAPGSPGERAGAPAPSVIYGWGWG
ncbi:peptidoglycan DD-metalloendopeptidase family protein [Streptomyces sp. SID5785]|uniref:murein hydrolase activator EnvC family protein n=1 Tax=Streptomyces sp. SID5785 TaxID=2690309 RepID=UPI0013616A20|nr:M23 family metallopeptidase [Streptomyces sp. SID5785]MZD08524.1 peptidoglycan DD-metalloendopeptidase family protein [Streptomyces sp. SID5785]